MADAIPVNTEPQEKPAARGKNKGAAETVSNETMAELKATPKEAPSEGTQLTSHQATRKDN